MRIRRRWPFSTLGGRALSACLALVAFMVLSAMSARAEEWFEYKPEGGGFRVELPGRPKALYKGDATVQIPAGVYGVNYVKISASAASDPQTFLDKVPNAVVRFGKLRSVEHLMIGSSPARRIVIEERTGGITTALAVLHGNQFITIACAESAHQGTSNIVEHIIKSFVLVDQ